MPDSSGFGSVSVPQVIF